MGSSSEGKVRCEHCNKAYAWQEKYAGKKVRCKCGEVMRFPAQCPTEDGMELELNLDSGIDLNLGASGSKPAAKSALGTPDGKINVPPPANMGGPSCPSCKATVRPGAVICVSCGYHLKQGSKLNTNIGVQMSGSGMVYDQPADGIFGRFKRSWTFAKISYGMIWDFKQLLLFPIFSGIAALLIFISFLVPIVMYEMNQADLQSQTIVAQQTQAATVGTSGVDALPAADTSSDTVAVATPPRELTPNESLFVEANRKLLTDSGQYTKEEVDAEMAKLKDTLISANPSGTSDWDDSDEPIRDGNVWDMLLLFAFYFCNYFVIVFFNTGLIACAMKITVGEVPTVGYGMKVAMKRLPQIIAWAFVSAIVGVILRIIENASEKVGKFVALLLGSAWTVLTFFVVPVIAVEGVGPVKAVSRSVKTLKDAWGEAAVGNFSMGLLTFVVTLPIYMVMFAAFVLVMMYIPSLTAMVVMFSVFVFVTIIITAASSAADTVFKALLYNFASGRALPAGVDTEAISSAFAMSHKGGIFS